jgi:hypothetical protein
MKISKLVVFALWSVFLMTSCSNEDDVVIAKPEPNAFENGIFILNEGSSGQGSVSFLSNDLNSFTQNAYTAANPGDLMGKYAQSIFFNEDNAYIISNGSNKINVVNKKTLKLVAKIETGLIVPRYGVVNNSKAYVTNANSYSFANPTTGNTDDFLSVINLTTNTIEATVPLNATADKLVFDNGKIYIIDAYNNNRILVFNTANNSLEAPINIGLGANSLEVSNGFLYVLRSPSTFPISTPSQLVKVNLSTRLFTTLDFPAIQTDAKNLDIENSKLYYTIGTSVYAMNLTDTVAPTTSIFSYTSTSQYGQMYGFAVKGNRVYIADGGNFSENSKAYVYSLTGTLLKEATVGVGPNGFYFN